MLPLRFAGSPEELGPAPVVFVDGSPLGPSTRPDGDLHLSHWPGNRTPAALRRDLSTEIALAFLDLPEAERARLVGETEALVLNHYDTDGVCAAYCLTRPERARPHADLLHGIAGAGDLFLAGSERVVAIDAALRNLADPERSPLARDLADEPPSRRRQALLERALVVLDELLDDAEAHGDLWRPDLERHRAGTAQLTEAAFDDLVYMDLGVWTGRAALEGDAAFDPGRHGFLGDGRLDRALLLGPRGARGAQGTTVRFVVGTRSFFDIVSSTPSPRPDLEALRDTLRAAEPEGESTAATWHCHDPRGASPELWFGTEGLPLYAEHAAEFLRPSAIDLNEIKRHVIDAVRATWPLPDDDDEAEDGEDIFAV